MAERVEELAMRGWKRVLFIMRISRISEADAIKRHPQSEDAKESNQ